MHGRLRSIAVLGQQAFARTLVEQTIEQEAHLRVGQRQPQVVARDLFDGVCFVQHDQIVSWQQRRASILDRDIREQHGMVDHEQVRVLGLLPCPAVEATRAHLACVADALVRITFYTFPHQPVRLRFEVGKRAVFGLCRPLLDAPQFILLPVCVEEHVAALARSLQTPLADVVAPPLDQNGAKRPGQHGGQERHVLVDNLFLQGDRVCADDHTPTLLGHVFDGGDEIGEALADPGARFHQKVLAFFKRLRHRVRHGQLRRANLVTRQLAGDHAACTEYFFRIKRHGFPLRGS